MSGFLLFIIYAGHFHTQQDVIALLLNIISAMEI